MHIRCAMRVKNKKADIWISVILYMLIIVATTLLVLEVGLPLLNQLKAKNLFAKTEDTMLNIGQHIRDIASEGQGSQRLLSIDIKDGKLIIENDRLRWKVDSTTKIIEPRTTINKGDLIIRTNADVSVIETNETFIVENNLIMANFSKTGNESSWESIATVSLINNMMLKSNSAYTTGNFTFSINNDAASATGNGYTKMLDTGTDLGSATFLAHVNSTTYEYDIKLTLESQADFLKVELGSINPK